MLAHPKKPVLAAFVLIYEKQRRQTSETNSRKQHSENYIREGSSRVVLQLFFWPKLISTGGTVPETLCLVTQVMYCIIPRDSKGRLSQTIYPSQPHLSVEKRSLPRIREGEKNLQSCNLSLYQILCYETMF